MSHKNCPTCQLPYEPGVCPACGADLEDDNPHAGHPFLGALAGGFIGVVLGYLVAALVLLNAPV